MMSEPPDEHILWVRGECDYLQSRDDDLDHVIPKEKLRKFLSQTRDCMTTQMKHMPKTKHLFTAWQKAKVRDLVSAIITAKDAGAEPPSGVVGLLMDILTFPQNFHDNYDDMFTEHFQTFEQYKMAYIIETRRQHTDDGHYVQEWSEEIEKRLHKEYERDKKEWEKKQHGD